MFCIAVSPHSSCFTPCSKEIWVKAATASPLDCEWVRLQFAGAADVDQHRRKFSFGSCALDPRARLLTSRCLRRHRGRASEFFESTQTWCTAGGIVRGRRSAAAAAAAAARWHGAGAAKSTKAAGAGQEQEPEERVEERMAEFYSSTGRRQSCPHAEALAHHVPLAALHRHSSCLLHSRLLVSLIPLI
jgi:hypothetical protein